MNYGIADTFKFLTQQSRIELFAENIDIVLCPPFTSLYTISVALAESRIAWGAQNCHHEEVGAFTGEISAEFLSELGCRYVIIGHSERRMLFHETDETIAPKVLKVLERGLTPILCVGETLAQREEGTTWRVLEEQLCRGTREVGRRDLERLVIAYEPVWAIGTGMTATPEIAQEAHHFIRDWLGKRYSRGFAIQVRLLYGGSVKPDNVKALMGQEDIDGALVGGASLSPEQFRAILVNCT
jgi:triosephosphate isomerase